MHREVLPCRSAGPAACSQSSLCFAVGPAEQPGESGRISTTIAVLLVRKQSPGEDSEPLVLQPSGWDVCQSEFVWRCWLHILGLESGASDTGGQAAGN